MAWTDPKVNWDENYEPSPQDMNRIEENTYALKNEAIEIDGEKTFKEDATFEKDVAVDGDANVTGDVTVTGAVSTQTVDTGQGANELYAMNQNVRTSDAVTFAQVSGVRSVNGSLHGELTSNAIFDSMKSHMSTGQSIIVSGGVRDKGGSPELAIASYAYRVSDTKIRIYHLDENGNTEYFEMTDGVTLISYDISLAW